MRQVWPHRVEHAVAPDERVEKAGREMHQDQREETEREIEMRVPQAEYAGSRFAARSAAVRSRAATM